MTQTINHEFFYPHPAATVWEYLTNPDLMELWLMKNNFKPVVGHEFQFTTGPIPNLRFDGIFHCKVLEVVPFEKLSYSWGSGPGDGVITLDSVVVWKLRETAEGTDVSLQHSGFEKPENADFFNGLKHGWVEKLEKIDHLLKSTTDVQAKA